MGKKFSFYTAVLLAANILWASVGTHGQTVAASEKINDSFSSAMHERGDSNWKGAVVTDQISDIIEREKKDTVPVTVDGQQYMIVTLKKYIDPVTLECSEVTYTPIVYVDAQWNPVSQKSIAQKIQQIYLARSLQDKHIAVYFNRDVVINMENTIKSPNYRIGRYCELFLDIPTKAIARLVHEAMYTSFDVIENLLKSGIRSAIKSAKSKNLLEEIFYDPSVAVEFSLYFDLDSAKIAVTRSLNIEQGKKIDDFHIANEYLRNLYSAQAYLGVHWRNALFKMSKLDQSTWSRVWELSIKICEAVINYITVGKYDELKTLLMGLLGEVKNIPWINEYYSARNEALASISGKLSPSESIFVEYTLSLAKRTENIFSIPDLTISSVDIYPSSVDAGNSVSVIFTITNSEDMHTGYFTTRISLSIPPSKWGTDILLGNFDMVSLEGNSSRQSTIVVHIPRNVSPGDYYITVYADVFQEIDESDEGNNIGSSEPQILSVEEAIKIDLAVMSADAPSSTKSGETIPVEFTIINQGNSPSNTFGNRFFLATNPQSTGSLLGSFNMTSLDGGESRYETVELTIPADVFEDDYYITVLTDAFGANSETNENNNIGSTDKISIWGSGDTTPPTVRVGSPNGGEDWVVSSQHTIRWNATDDVGVNYINIQFNSNEGASWSDIVTGIANSGEYTWTIPDNVSNFCRVKVIAYDFTGNSGFDESENFSISLHKPPPKSPDLYDPGSLSETGNFYIYWSRISEAEEYILEEDVNTSFNSPELVRYVTTQASCHITGKKNDVYYYQVKAQNDLGSSGWSNVVDMEVRVNSAPNIPSNPSPSNGANNISRDNLTLSWRGGDPDGTVDYAVFFGSYPSDLVAYRGFGSGETGEFFELPFTLDPKKTYYWYVKAKDDKGLVTEGPIWHFTTEYSYPDIVPTALIVNGTITPSSEVVLNLTVENRGTFTASSCEAFFYYSSTSTGKDERFGNIGTIIPQLLPGTQTTVTKTVTLNNLRAGKSYIVTAINTEGYFIDRNLENNIISCSINYQDDNSPTIKDLNLRWGIGPEHDRFKTGHEYFVVFSVDDDIGVESLDFYYSTDNGTSWDVIVTGFIIGSNGYANSYGWTIPPDAPLTTEAKIKMIARDVTGNASVETTDVFTIIDGSVPNITVTSPNGGEVWDLGSQHEITWGASSSSGIEDVRIYLCCIDKTDFIAHLEGNVNSYTWTIPSSSTYVSNTARIKIVVVDGNWNEAEDWSDDYFVINDPSSPPPPPWHIPELVSNANSDIAPSISVDQNGDVHLVYLDKQDYTGEPRVIVQEIIYKSRVNSSWSSQDIAYSLTQNTDANLTNYQYIGDIKIAVDSKNNPHLVWLSGIDTRPIDRTSRNTKEIYYCYYNGTIWSSPINISSNDTESYFPGIAIDSGDNVHIIWTDGVTWNANNTFSGQTSLYYRKKDTNGNWSGTIQLTNESVYQSDLAIDQFDNLHVVFVSGTGTGIYYFKSNGNEWLNPFMAVAPSGSDYFPDISCEPNGNGLHLVWYNDYNGLRVLYSHYDGTSWSPSEEVNDPNLDYFASYPLIAVDSSNDPHVVWEEQSHGGVVYRQKQHSGWSKKIQINLSSHYVDKSTDVAISLNDVLHTVWISYSKLFYNWADVSLSIDTEAPTVTLTLPAGGEHLSIGQTYEIRWNASDNVGVSSISLKYSTDGESFTEIASGENNDGTYEWVVPNIFSNIVQIWLIASDGAGNQGSDVSGYFSISDQTVPIVSLISPNGGETWIAESQHNITWSAEDNVEVTSIDLFYSADAGKSWLIIANDEPNDGTYLWTIPYNLSSNCQVKVIAFDSSDHMNSDVSNGIFSITTANNPPYTPHSPVPVDGSSNVYTLTKLMWTGGDPDSIDVVTYDIYFGTESDLMNLVSDDLSHTSYALSTLKTNTTYYWKITASDGKQSSQGPIWSFTTGTESINTPSDLSAVTISNNQIDLSWKDNSSNEEGFKIERKKEIDEAYSEIAVVGPDSCTYSDVGLNGGTSYIYRMCAYHGSDHSVYSNEARAVTANSPPDIPIVLSPLDNSTNQAISIVLKWQGTDPDSSDTLTYDVYFGTSMEPPLVSDDQSDTTYNPSTLDNHEFYFWKVVAVDNHGAQIQGPVWSFVTEPETIPVAPDSLEVISVSNDSIVFRWNDNSENDIGFIIERRLEGLVSIQIYTVDSNVTTYCDTVFSEGETYHYRVRAYNASGNSEHSNVLDVEVLKIRNEIYDFTDQGWQLISLPVTVENNSVNQLFPSSLNGIAFYYDVNTQSYISSEELATELGYWIAIPNSITNIVQGVAFESYIRQCNRGWNLLGSVLDTVEVSTIRSDPNGSVLAVFGWNPNEQDYFLTDKIIPGNGYWFALSQDCEITISYYPFYTGLAKIKKKKLPESFIKNFGDSPPPPPGQFTSVSESGEIPDKYDLSQNYPNPFNPTTTIQFDLPKDDHVEIFIYNVMGQKVVTLVNKDYTAGSYQIMWDGRSENNQAVATGVYIVYMKTESFHQAKKLLLIR